MRNTAANFAIVSAILYAICLSWNASAQVVVQDNASNRWYTDVPARVEMNVGEKASVVVERIWAETADEAFAAAPATAQVFTKRADGTTVRGAYLDSRDGRSKVQFRPLSVDWNGSAFSVTSSTWCLGESQAFVSKGSETIPIRYAPALSRPFVPRGPQPWSIEYSLSGQFLLLPQSVLLQVFDCLDRAATRFQSIITSDGGHVVVQLELEPLPSGSAASTGFSSGSITLNYSPLRGLLIGQASDNGESPAEVNMYQNGLPFGSTIQAYVEGSPQTTASFASITVHRSLLQAFFVPGLLNEVDATTTFNSNLPYDFDPTDGVGLGQLDFEATLMHETFHALGFSSSIDYIPTGTVGPPPFMLIMDMFRMDGLIQPVNGGYTLTQLSGLPRMLRRNQAQTCALLPQDASATFPMSRGAGGGGDGKQASHFLASNLTPNFQPIGIMDPTGHAGGIGDVGISRPDILALDIVGWNIPSNVVGSPTRPTLTSPADQTFITAANGVTLQWQADSTVNSSNVAVFERQAGVERQRVFRALNVAGTSVSVPPSVLLPGKEYSWHVVTVNDLGFGHAAPMVFYTRVVCRADFNNSGFLSSQDIFDFLGAWFAGSISADFDLSGGLAVADIFAFLQAWFAGC